MVLKLKAIVRRAEAGTIRRALEQLPATGTVRKAGDEFVVEAAMEGTSARPYRHIHFAAGLIAVEVGICPLAVMN
jgi:hypothetical protein